jgi:hypothetical protein
MIVASSLIFTKAFCDIRANMATYLQSSLSDVEFSNLKPRQ